MLHRRTAIVATLANAAALAGCGFHLRSSQTFAFQTLAVTPERNGLVAADLIRYFDKSIVPLVPVRGSPPPQVIVDILQEAREKDKVGINASGQVREFQLRLRLQFRMRLPDGRELIAPTEIFQQRDISFNESVVLAKEAEEVLLFRDMQSDILQQLLRRLAAIKTLDIP
ncbi:MAG: LPS assembly lipoprotein LptE [Pseudomonadota bacterium]